MSSRTSQRKSTKGEYIETETGNKISRRAKIEGTPHIILAGRVVVQAEACLRGDLCRPASNASETKESSRTSITVGRYTLISAGATLHPPHRSVRGEMSFLPMKIGENVFIGAGSFVSAATVGSHVHIGADCVIGANCVVKDNVKILDGTVMTPGMVAPNGVVIGGRPARIIEDLPDGWGAGSSRATPGDWVEGGELRELIRSIR